RPLRRAGSRRTAGRLSGRHPHVCGVPAGTRPTRRWAALLVLTALLLAAALRAQADDNELVLHVYTLRHQAAGDALGLVQPLLSPRGTIELRPGANTLVLRDTAVALGRIVPVLVSFDHPSRPVDVELWMVRASGRNPS